MDVNTVKKMNACYAQSGGMTAVINITACAVIEASQLYPERIGKVFAAKNGILGLLNEELYDTSHEDKESIAHLRYMPGGIFGSCRYKLKEPIESTKEYERILEVFKAHRIGYFFYNGGNDSADTAYKIAVFSQKVGYPLVCIAIPKTIDNDLAETDNCPGYASVAKFISTTTREMNLDIAAMSPATQIYILEVMGRHSGWIAASSGMAKEKEGDAPHIILFPEIPFDPKNFLQRVDQTVKKNGYCFITTSESIRDHKGQPISDTGQFDAFGHLQMGGVAPVLANMIKNELGYKYHYSIAGYLLRTSRHLGSKVDIKQAYAIGREAVKLAMEGKNHVAPIIIRESNNPYRWRIGTTSLEKIANFEKNLPRDFISEDGFSISKKCQDYLFPLIQGEDFPPFKNGLPEYPSFKKVLVRKKLPIFKMP
jgi:ATP-dependent phosphofructokinase / diphosphate-dependent phosphofructokinase